LKKFSKPLNRFADPGPTKNESISLPDGFLFSGRDAGRSDVIGSVVSRDLNFAPMAHETARA
jgi:hypothetical protein